MYLLKSPKFIYLFGQIVFDHKLPSLSGLDLTYTANIYNQVTAIGSITVAIVVWL